MHAILMLLAAASPSLDPRNAADAAAIEARIKADLSFLASKECEGRGVETEGINKAADHIAAVFQSSGLKPAPGTDRFFQPFTMTAGKARLGATNTLLLTPPDGKEQPLTYGEEFTTVGLSAAGKVTAPVVFAGYGISAKEEHYDDYADLDVAGKIVIVLRQTPRPGSEDKPFGGDRNRSFAALANKLLTAEQHKAKGVIFVNDRHTARDGDTLMPFEYTATESSPARIPAVHIHRDRLDQMLKAAKLTSLKEREETIDRDGKPQSVALDWSAAMETSLNRPTVAVKNIIAVSPGEGPLAKEYVVIGAHYDHLGFGEPGSLAKLKEPAIHYGADDNGSGSAALLELARQFGGMPHRQGRSIIFIAFTGEERGLVGSQHYVKNPVVPLESTVAMVNMDMVGRLRPDPEDKTKEKLTVYGIGSAKGFETLIEKLNEPYGFKLSKVTAGTGPSDHTSFYQKGVPVFFFFTGTHQEYHTPADTPETINYAGIRKIVGMVTDTLLALSTEATRPEYVKGATGSPSPGRMNIPRLGFMPGNYDEEEGKGVLIGGVTKDGPADKAGLKEGDFIVEIAGKPVRNMAGYMTVIGGQKRGNEIELGVQRGKERLKLKVLPQ